MTQMHLSKEEILKLIEENIQIEITEDSAREQVYLCLNCNNSWEDTGFSFNKISFSFICNSCEQVVWTIKNSSS